MDEPRFVHDCKSCVFQGRGYYQQQEVDWWTCGPDDGGRGGRTVIARRSDDGPDYASGEIGVCVGVTLLEMAALGQGLDLLPIEKDRLLKILLTQQHASPPRDLGWKGYHDWVDHPDGTRPLGDANWLDVITWDEE